MATLTGRWSACVALVAGLAACASWQQLADRWEPARTTVVTPAFTLESPFDAEGTAAWTPIVAEELACAASLLGTRGAGTLTVKLVPAPFEGTETQVGELTLRQGTHAKDSVAGHAGPALVGDRLYVVVYVDGEPASLAHVRAWADALRPVLRHELVHACAYRAVAPFESDNRWFHEGLAVWLTALEPAGDGTFREPRLLPLPLVEAHLAAGTASLQQVVDWDDAVDVTTRYQLAASLVRYLVGRQQGDSVAERGRRVVALSRRQLLHEEGRWRAWLAAEDGLDALASELTCGDPQRVEAAALRVRTLAFDLGWQVVSGPRFHALMRPLLTQPDAASSALLYFVVLAGRLAPELVDELCDADDVTTALTGQAVRAKRGESVDQERAARLWSTLDQRGRIAAYAAGQALGLSL